MTLLFPSSPYLHARPKALAQRAVRILRNPPRTREGRVDESAISLATNELAVALQAQGHSAEKVLGLLAHWSQPHLLTPAHEVSSGWSDETLEQIHERVLMDLEQQGPDLTSPEAARARAALTAVYWAEGHGTESARIADTEVHRALARHILKQLKRLKQKH